jgi:hypothetical protein
LLLAAMRLRLSEFMAEAEKEAKEKDEEDEK